MAQTSSILLNAGDRERLTALVADRNRPHKHVQRARLILCAGDRLRGHALDRAPRGGAGRPRAARAPADLASPPRRAPSRAHLQALERSGVCREGGGHCRALHEPACARGAAAAHALARYRFPGNRLIYGILFSSIIFPPQITLISL